MPNTARRLELVESLPARKETTLEEVMVCLQNILEKDEAVVAVVEEMLRRGVLRRVLH